MKFLPILSLAAVLIASSASAQTNSASTNTPPISVKAKAKSKTYAGTVISVDRDAKTFTISLEKGKMKVLHFSDKTRFKKDGVAATFADLTLGEAVKGSCHSDDAGELISTTVNISLPPIDATQ